MSEFKLTSVEEFEQATNELLETGAKVGADAWQFRVKNQTPHCKFGEQGTCCRICTMGPCRITPKAPRGICGCDVHGIVGRNFLRFTAGGSATHSDHGREICHTLHEADPNGNYKVKDPEKLIRIAKEWGVETEGKDIYDLAHEMSELALLEYGKPFGTQRFLKRAPQHTQEIWEREEIAPRAIDREVACSLHMTHMGCSSLPEALVRQSLRSGLSDGWGGSMMGTEFSDVLFGTPKPIETEANLGVMKEDEVNIIVHGHDPSLSEMICEYADDPEMIAYAKEMGMIVIVTDHHEVPYTDEGEERIYHLPPADAVVDPKQPGCEYPFKGLCGAAVAYKLVEALCEANGQDVADLDYLLENVAIATVADVMDLTEENRILVKQGLEMLKRTSNLGLRALIQCIGLEGKKIQAYHIGFILAPCLNASGKLDTAKRALALLRAKTGREADMLAGDLKALNESRRDMTDRVVDDRRWSESSKSISGKYRPCKR